MWLIMCLYCLLPVSCIVERFLGISPKSSTELVERGGGHSTLGYESCATKKILLLFARFHRKTPIFTNFQPMTPYFSRILAIFNKLLVTERSWHIVVTPRPFIFAFNSQTSYNFWQKIRFFKNFDKCDEMLRNFWPFCPWKPLFVDTFHWKTPYICPLCHWKTPFLMQFVT